MKKTLAIISAIALLCVMAVGTTLSYFTDEDGDVNTMTVGKVGITQKINGQENGAVSAQMFPVTKNDDGTLNNVVNIAVTVTMDTSSQNAYVRTVFAFEMKKVGDEWVNPIGTDVILVQDGVTIENDVTFVKNGVQYVVGVYSYGELEAGDTTTPSLKQVYLDSEVGNEFSDAVDGKYDILVLSQAVQKQGFADAETALNTAFGEVNGTNAADWFN